MIDLESLKANCRVTIAALRDFPQFVRNGAHWLINGKFREPLCEQAADQIEYLLERLEASEKDAKRYQYLRSEHPVNMGEPFIGRQNLIGAFSRWTEEHADAAIDAQIAARKE